MKRTIIRTETGSVYEIAEDDAGRLWLTADNVPNPGSLDISDVHWQISVPAPWPPVVGERIRIESFYFNEHGHPNRIPGGGKRTSRVVEITEL